MLPAGAIILTGGTGCLGRSIAAEREGVVFPNRAQMDITNIDSVMVGLRAVRPRIVIHCAALVGRKECEIQPRLAEEVNVTGTRNIVSACGELKSKLVFISTPAVFDGTKGNYEEDDPPNPQYLYGAMKLIGENLVSQLDSHLIVRTDFFSTHGFKYQTVLNDHFCSKEPAPIVARKILQAIGLSISGVIHIGGPRRRLYDIVHDEFPTVTPIETSESSMPDFPKDFSLCTRRFALMDNGCPVN